MRGLAEIRKVNRNPHDDHREEHFGTRHVGGDRTDFTHTEARMIAGLLLGAALGIGERPRRPAPIIDEQPPFFNFWRKLNETRFNRGEDVATYPEARLAFEGGPTPEGALTFVGAKFDGLRAVPAGSVGGRRTYHGEFRQVTEEDGTVWRVVHGQNGPIAYGNAEAALDGARHAKLHSETHLS